MIMLKMTPNWPVVVRQAQASSVHEVPSLFNSPRMTGVVRLTRGGKVDIVSGLSNDRVPGYIQSMLREALVYKLEARRGLKRFSSMEYTSADQTKETARQDG